MEYSHDGGPPFPLLVIVILGVIVVGGVMDLILDAPTDWVSFHVLFELGMIAISLAAASYLAWGWYQTAGSLAVVKKTLQVDRADRDAWRASARRFLDGLGVEMDRQFEGWRLTPTERETALALLKGASHKEIAGRTSRSERTVRQHAVAIYKKSGLRGRAELAGFFLDDLALPGHRIEESQQ